jgi:hypothetical protein
MRTKLLPIGSLVLALFFGARTANRSDQVAGGLPVPVKVEKRNSSKKETIAAPPPKTPSVVSTKDCGDAGATAAFEKEQWWLSQRRSPGCSLSLSPVWREICKLNPARSIHTDTEVDNDLLDPKLTIEQFISRCLGDPHFISSMMASVPDPQRTHLGLLTDRTIEAIQVAAGEARFLPRSHYLPWPSSASNSVGLQLSAESESQSDSPDPGVLIFSDAATPTSSLRPRYLLVFLIPELPTEGLDRKAFSRAVTIMDKVSPSSKIEFDGPNFSGSVASLRALDDGLGDTRCIHAVSGSVTNAEEYEVTKSHCSSSLTLMQTSDDEAICQFVRGAKAFGYKETQIAILSEEGTLYGNQGSQRNSACKDDETAGLWFLHFPREISKLRNAYGAETNKSAASDPATQTGLEIQWQDPQATQHEDVQTYGGQQTPLSQETVLSTLAITLKTQGIKALGILATDPTDEAFLIHSVKKSSPDVRLFLRDPDLLYLRTPDVGSLNGTLLVSNYPIIPENQFWSSTKELPIQLPKELPKQLPERLITFPSAWHEEEYNAFIELIDKAGLAPPGYTMKRLEWRWPAAASTSPDVSDPGKSKPLWLATIGTAGHYPVTLLNSTDVNNVKNVNQAALGLHSLELGPPQFLPFMFWVAIAGLGLLHVFALRVPAAIPSYFKRDFELRDMTDTVTLVRIMCHMIAILTVALAQLIVGSGYLFFYGSGWRYALLACGVGAVTVILVAAAWSQLRTLSALHRQQEPLAVPDERSRIVSPKRIFRTSIIGMVIMVGAGLFWVVMTNRGHFDTAFLHFRDLNLLSGVAPSVPLTSVLLVMYFGIWGYLRRLSYWEHRYVQMFDVRLDAAIAEDLGADVRAIDACLLGPLENSKWMAAYWLALGGSILAFRPWVTLDMVEPSSVWLFVLFFIVLALLTLWLNWFRFINIWVHLRNILEHLENLPIRAAFERLPREKSLPILQWDSPQSSFLLRQVLDKLRALACADASEENVELKKQFELRIDALMNHGVVQTEIVEYRKVVGGSPRATLRTISRSQNDPLLEARSEMTKVIDILSARLLGEYWRRGSSVPKPGVEPPPADLKYVLAEDIVALPFYAYIRKVVSELRNILFFLGIAVSLLFVAFHTYAFRADEAIDWWFFGMFAFMGGGVVVIVAQMERNALLSRLSNGTPGQLGTNFYLQLLKYGTVPFLTIFGSQVPSISNFLLKWVQPAVQALH